MRVSSASGRAHERHARGGVEDRAAGGARRGRDDASGPHRADVADPRVRGPDRRRAGKRERQAVRAGPRCGAVPPRRGQAVAAGVWTRQAGAGIPGWIFSGAEVGSIRGRGMSDPGEALANAKAAADRIVKAKRLNACLTPPKELRQSLQKQAQAAHPSGVLYGMPVAVKDNICTLEFTTTCGSKILAGYRSPYEATAVAKLKAAGALVAGKTNCDEFGMGSSTEHSAYGRALHPIDKTRVPGGSSGGSAALVAAGAVPAGLGSETGGSVRQPASFCGVVGIKPTYGRVSRSGLVAFGSSLDQIGVFGRSVHDAARVLSVISGRDPRGATCEARDSLRLPTVPESLQGFVIGVPKEYFPQDLDPAVRRACDRAIRLLRELGAAVREVSLPHTAYAIATYYIIAPAEASSNLARYDGARYGPRFNGSEDVRAKGLPFGGQLIGQAFLEDEMLEAAYALERAVPAAEEA